MDLYEFFKDSKYIEEYPAGNVIIEEGKPGKVMYVVLDGKVEIKVGDRTLAVAEPGDPVGELALADPGPRCASATVLEDCKLAVVTEQRYLALICKVPYFSINVMQAIAHRLRRMNDIAQGKD